MRNAKVMLNGIRNCAPHRARVVNNLTDIGNQLTTSEVAQGSQWYKEAENLTRRLGRRYGYTRHQAAGVLAAMSPNHSWYTNVVMAENVLAGSPRGFSVSLERSAKILEGSGEILTHFPNVDGNSHKIREFYRAIAGNEQAVVIDRWALRAAWGNQIIDIHNLERVGVYLMVSDGYKEVARLFGMTPRDFQASVWIHVRGSAL